MSIHLHNPGVTQNVIPTHIPSLHALGYWRSSPFPTEWYITDNFGNLVKPDPEILLQLFKEHTYREY